MAATPTVQGMRHIDIHVHCRDWEESYKATIESVMQLARSQGIVAICDMPNTKPPITSSLSVDRRIASAHAQGVTSGYYMYIGATSDRSQMAEAVHLANTHPNVVGIKLYAGVTTNPSIKITEMDAQRAVFRHAAEFKYAGAMLVHCEKESLARPDLWRPEAPWTWNLAKPPEMEIESVKDMIMLAREEGFAGKLHICHVSTPDAVKIVNEAQKKGDLRITCGVTPHHLTYSTEDMASASGMRFKVNPPLRERKSMRELAWLLRINKITLIETDHAPHAAEEKSYGEGASGAYLSGIRSLEGYSNFLQGLVNWGTATLDDITRLTYTNPKALLPKIKE